MTIDERLERIERLLVISSKNVLNVEDMALVLGISESRLRHLVLDREMPHYKQGRRIYFKKSEIEAWQLDRRVSSNAEIESQAATYVALGKK